MAVIDLILSDADQERFARQARREGMSLSDWIRAAAEDRIADRQTLIVSKNLKTSQIDPNLPAQKPNLVANRIVADSRGQMSQP